MRKLYVLLLTLLFSSSVFAAGKTVNYKVDGAAYEGYYVSPKPGAPLVLLVHDWDGLTDYEVQRSNLLADMGYSVFAVDLFGVGVRPTKTADKRQHTGELYKDRKKMRALLQAGLNAAKSEGAKLDKAVAVGYCFGGAAVLELARSGADLDGFVTFHGGLSTPDGQDYKNTKGKLLILHGTADTAISMNDFSSLASELETQGVKHEMITYSGAPHAFTVFGSGSYRKDSDTKSWQRFTEFLSDAF